MQILPQIHQKERLTQLILDPFFEANDSTISKKKMKVAAIVPLVILSTLIPLSNAKCNETLCSTNDKEVCVTIFNQDESIKSEECARNSVYYNACQELKCPHKECHVYFNSPTFNKEVISCTNAKTHEKLKDGSYNSNQIDESLPWCIVLGILSLLPLLILAYIVFYRFVYKMPRIGKEKEDLKQLFNSYGYDENNPLYREVFEFFYE